MNISTNSFGLTIGGEWSLASALPPHVVPPSLPVLSNVLMISLRTVNDCGKWLNNVGNGQRYDGTYYTPGNTTAPAFAAVGSCDEWNVSDSVLCACTE